MFWPVIFKQQDLVTFRMEFENLSMIDDKEEYGIRILGSFGYSTGISTFH